MRPCQIENLGIAVVKMAKRLCLGMLTGHVESGCYAFVHQILSLDVGEESAKEQSWSNLVMTIACEAILESPPRKRQQEGTQ